LELGHFRINRLFINNKFFNLNLYSDDP
jgi:hypothetical protein